MVIKRKLFKLDGGAFSTLDEFYIQVSRALEIDEAGWCHNLDDFNHILRGGFGTPKEGFVLVWFNSSISQQRLGYWETAQQLRYTPLLSHSIKHFSTELFLIGCV